MDKCVVDLIKVAGFMPASLKFPPSWIGHLPFAAWVVQQARPALLVELGTHTGNSYFGFCQAVQECSLPTRCYAVDTWQGDSHAGGYSEEVFDSVYAWNQRHYEAFSRLLQMPFDEAVHYFSDDSIEMLHIDGLHTYDAVWHDFETWLPKLCPGALILFHDTNVRERDFGVWRFWEELCAKYSSHLEFSHCNGLGVLQIPGAGPHRQLAWLESHNSEKQLLKQYFATLGARQFERYELIRQTERLSEIKHSLVRQNTEIKALQETLSQRDREVAETKNQLFAIEASTMSHPGLLWRSSLTRVARGLRLLRLLPRLIHRHGGMKASFRHLLILWNQEGYSGIHWRLATLSKPPHEAKNLISQ